MKPLGSRRRAGARWAGCPTSTAVEPRSLFATRVYVGVAARRGADRSACRTSRASRPTSWRSTRASAPAAGTSAGRPQRPTHTKGSTAEIGDRRECCPQPAACIAADQRRRPQPHRRGPGRRAGTSPSTRPRRRSSRSSGATGYTSLGLPPARRQPRRPPSAPSRPSATELRATTCVHRVRRPAGHPASPAAIPARPTSRSIGEHAQRHHAARAALRARARVQHDDDADRRADRRDRRDEGDRRPPPRHPAHLPAHRAAVRRRWARSLGVALGDRDREPRSSASSRISFFGIDARVRRLGAGRARQPGRRARRRRRSRRCPPSGAPRACRWTRRCTPPGSAVGGQGRLDALLRRVHRLPRAASRSACAASGAASAGASPRCCRSASRSDAASRCSRSAPASARPRAQWFDDNHFDIWVQAVASKPLDADAQPTGQLHQGVAPGAQAVDEQRRASDGQGRRRLGSAGPAADDTRHRQRPLVHRRRSRARDPRRGARPHDRQAPRAAASATRSRSAPPTARRPCA